MVSAQQPPDRRKPFDKGVLNGNTVWRRLLSGDNVCSVTEKLKNKNKKTLSYLAARFCGLAVTKDLERVELSRNGEPGPPVQKTPTIVVKAIQSNSPTVRTTITTRNHQKTCQQSRKRNSGKKKTLSNSTGECAWKHSTKYQITQWPSEHKYNPMYLKYLQYKAIS